MLQYHQGSLAHCCDLNFYFDSLSIKRFRSSDIITLFNRHQSVKEHHASTRRHQCPGSLPPRRVLTVVDHTLTSDRNSVTCHLNIAKPSPTKVYRDLRNLASLSVSVFKTDLVSMDFYCKSMLRPSWPLILIPLPTSSTAFCAPS